MLHKPEGSSSSMNSWTPACPVMRHHGKQQRREEGVCLFAWLECPDILHYREPRQELRACRNLGAEAMQKLTGLLLCICYIYIYVIYGCIWRSKGNLWESVLAFYHLGFQEYPRVIRLVIPQLFFLNKHKSQTYFTIGDICREKHTAKHQLD